MKYRFHPDAFDEHPNTIAANVAGILSE